jgi:hypothetical protein
VVNCFQPSLKLQAQVHQGERVRREYDVAQTPLQRLLASGVLSEDRHRDLSVRIQQIDPLALSEQLDALRSTLLCAADRRVWHQPSSPFLVLCTSIPVPASEEEPEWTGHREAPASGKEIGHQALESAASATVEALLHGLGTIHPFGSSGREERWPVECIPGGHLLPGIPVAAVSCDDQDYAQDQLFPSLGSVTPSNSSRERDAEHPALITIEQAIAGLCTENA